MPEKGDAVFVSGLEQTKFNGSGTVDGPFDPQKGRWPIKVGAKIVLVKEKNLVFLPQCFGPLKGYILQNGLGEATSSIKLDNSL